MPQESENPVLRKALLGGGVGFGLGALSDILARTGILPAPFGYNPHSPGGQWALDNPIAAPAARGLVYAAPLAILAAIAENYKQARLKSNPPMFPDEMMGKYSIDHTNVSAVEELVKSASFPQEDREPLIVELMDSYVKENADQLVKECNTIVTHWAEGFVKECEAVGRDPEELMKQAALPALALPFLLWGGYEAGKHGIGAARSAMAGQGKDALKHLGYAGLGALTAVPMLGPTVRGLSTLARVGAMAGKTGKMPSALRYTGEAAPGFFKRLGLLGGNLERGAAGALGIAMPKATTKAWRGLRRIQGSRPYQRITGTTLGRIFDPKLRGGAVAGNWRGKGARRYQASPSLGGPGFLSLPTAAYMGGTMAAPMLMGPPPGAALPAPKTMPVRGNLDRLGRSYHPGTRHAPRTLSVDAFGNPLRY
jgi:hypothetical protein